MIPIVLGTIASSIQRVMVPPYSSYIVTTDCSGGSPYTVYTEFQIPLILGTLVYADLELTLPKIEVSFVYNNATLTTDISGYIVTSITCYNQFTVTADCSGNTPTVVYTVYNTTPTIGTFLYVDSALTVPWANISLFVYGGNRYSTNGSGFVTSPISGPAVCPTSFTVYSNCQLDGPQTVYSESPTITTGVTIYQDENLSVLYEGSFVYNSDIYTILSGVVQPNPTSCPTSFVIYNDCVGTTPTTVWSESDTITTGTTLYLDVGLSIPFSGLFTYNYYNYSASGSGFVTFISPCSREWVTYTSCNNSRDGGTTTPYYTFFGDAVLQNNVIVYEDVALTNPANNLTIINSGNVYITDPDGKIHSVTACVYSLPFTSNGCGLTNDNTLYTASNAVTNQALFDNSARLFYDAGLTNIISLQNVYRYEYNTYITTDITGTVGGVTNCTT